MKSLLQEIADLPEGCDESLILPFFERAMREDHKAVSFIALDELADRQWHTYEKLAPEIACKVENWLLANWSRNSLSEAERLTSIVGRLGLIKVYATMMEEFAELPYEVQNEFRSFFDEVGNSVDDPYSGMS